MADNAFEKWARPRGLVRINEVHGVEEADIPYDSESWMVKMETGQRTEFQGVFDMEDLTA